MADVKKNYSLAELTTFKIGGPAKYFIEVREKDDLISAIDFAEQKKIPIAILGGGSNILIGDRGFKGLVAFMCNNRVSVHGERIKSGAGATLGKVLSLAINSGLSGLEWSHGIPRATVGGAIRGNAEAFGQSMADIVETVEIFNRKKKGFEILSNKMCDFSYRESLFKVKPDLIIWEAGLKMKTETQAAVLRQAEESIKFRLEKYPKLPSAGSIFKNLEALEVKASNKIFFERELKDKINRQGQISAGLIIDMLGLKGKTIGGAKVSLEHANHIVNTGKATADEIMQLISLIKQQARDRFGLNLHEEIQYIGDI